MTLKPFCDFQIVNPQPGSSLLFQDEHPNARRFSLISPSPFGHGPSCARSAACPSSPTISGSLPLTTSFAGCGPSSSASPCSNSARTSSAVTVNAPCDFQIVNPQPGSFLLL